MDVAFISGQMGENMKVAIYLIRNMAMVFINELMGKHLKANGLKGNNMAMVFIQKIVLIIKIIQKK